MFVTGPLYLSPPPMWACSVLATTKQNSEDEDPPLKVKQQIVSLSSREVLFSNTMHPVFPSACFCSRVEFQPIQFSATPRSFTQTAYQVSSMNTVTSYSLCHTMNVRYTYTVEFYSTKIRLSRSKNMIPVSLLLSFSPINISIVP